MWRVVQGKRLVESFNIEIEDTWLERDDGFIIICAGSNRDGVETFLCKSNFGNFRFKAFRSYREALEVYDRYIVLVKSFVRKWNFKREDNEALILSHAEDIESALKNFPLINAYKNIPVKEVLFDMSLPSETQMQLRAAKEIVS